MGETPLRINPTLVYATDHVSDRIVDVRQSDGTVCCTKKTMFDDKLARNDD